MKDKLYNGYMYTLVVVFLFTPAILMSKAMDALGWSGSGTVYDPDWGFIPVYLTFAATCWVATKVPYFNRPTR